MSDLLINIMYGQKHLNSHNTDIRKYFKMLRKRGKVLW
ncbi:hypothetical protein COPEUT_01567 [Coprococcus eutactus ATCC 27759]|nr:hypothetical protein COPEUT_01567 [Coprococcus eutactus ATCC 27759]